MFNNMCELEDERDRSIMKNLSAKDFDAYLKAKMDSWKVVLSFFKKILCFGKKTYKTKCLLLGFFNNFPAQKKPAKKWWAF